jgi:hypothetical protein
MPLRRAILLPACRAGLMMILTPWLAVPLAAQQTPQVGANWPVGSAPARFSVEADSGSVPSSLSWAELNLPDPRWAGMTIRVFNDSGVGVGSRALWSAPGEPIVLVFDSSSNAKHYDIYFGSDWPTLPLPNANSGVLLETRLGDGSTINDLPGMLNAWNKATTVEGRAILPGIFEGGNRFGPEANLLLHFTGWFNVTASEHLQLAVMSTDASFVLVDGREVAEWPGRHDIGGGMQGQHMGSVDLAAGLHQLDYYNAYGSPGGPPLLACLAAKGGPDEKWAMLMPGNTFFTPTDHAHVIDYATQGATAPPFAIDWKSSAQSVVGPESPDVGFITLSFTCHPQQAETVTWTFDDGTTAQGESVDHLFPRPGLRTVQVEVKSATGGAAPLRQLVHVHPDWVRLNTYPPALAPEAQADILARDPATFSPSDLAGCTAVFATFKATDALLKLQPTLCAKMPAMADADLPYIEQASLLLAPDLAHARESSALLQALLDRCSNPSLIAIASSARVALGQLTLLTTTHTDEVQALLAGVDPKALAGKERRAYRMLEADLALATGDVASARQQYGAMTAPARGPDERSSVRETGRIDQARIFLERKDDDAAETALDQVAQQSPLKKLSPDWELIRLRLYQDENLPDIAFLYATRLLPVMTGSERSELLYGLVDLAQQRGDRAFAARMLAELLQKHPYSEEAAKAKARWPGGF